LYFYITSIKNQKVLSTKKNHERLPYVDLTYIGPAVTVIIPVKTGLKRQERRRSPLNDKFPRK